MKIFYSWQSDLPNATNRGLIERALEKAAKTIRDDDSILVEPVVDRDTTGVPGAPDIAGTIFAKIEEAQVFVCDVSIINHGEAARPTPNPNVLIELGYALKKLGPERIIMVLNSAFGGPELLPFDLRMRRVVVYDMPLESEDRATERKRLEGAFEQGIRTILAGLAAASPGAVISLPSLAEQARTSIENARPDQAPLVRRFMAWLTNQVEAVAPDLPRTDDADEPLLQSIEQTAGLVSEFAKLAEASAANNASGAALAAYKGLGGVLEHYRPARGFSGVFREIDFDFYRFLGHELFVTLFSFLIREGRWELIADLLDEEIHVENTPEGGPGMVTFDYASRYIGLLDHRNRRLELGRLSLRADILNERHTRGELGELVPMRQFTDADYFLFLSGQLRPVEDRGRIVWKAWSASYMEGRPILLAEAARAKLAQQLLRPLGVGDIETLRARLGERSDKLWSLFTERSLFFDPPFSVNAQEIGVR